MDSITVRLRRSAARAPRRARRSTRGRAPVPARRRSAAPAAAAAKPAARAMRTRFAGEMRAVSDKAILSNRVGGDAGERRYATQEGASSPRPNVRAEPRAVETRSRRTTARRLQRVVRPRITFRRPVPREGDPAGSSRSSDVHCPTPAHAATHPATVRRMPNQKTNASTCAAPTRVRGNQSRWLGGPGRRCSKRVR